VDCRIQQGSREAGPQADRSSGWHVRGRGNASLLGEFILSCEGEVPLLFTENETNNAGSFPTIRTPPLT